MNTPKIFISYAHSSIGHKQTINDLAAVLRAHGLIVVVDSDVDSPVGPAGGWPKWMRKNISEANWVLMFFDETYHRCFNGEHGVEQGLGAVDETAIIMGKIYRAGSQNEKFIPLLADGGSANLIPDDLFGYNRYYIPKQAEELAMALNPSNAAQNPLQYKGVFDFFGYLVPFVPTLNIISPNPEKFAIRSFAQRNISHSRKSWRYVLPKVFENTEIRMPEKNLLGCRLDQHYLNNDILEFEFSQVSYVDYLKSGEHLDDAIPDDPRRTFRDEFGQLVQSKENVSLRSFALTNICGVGLFVLTSDRDVLITKHSASSHVYPKRWTFSASGTMRWGAAPDPFAQAVLKCERELNHQIDLKRTELVEVGADARKLFFECCFIENSLASTNEIQERLPGDLEAEFIPLGSVDEIIGKIVRHCWEPAAEAVLLLLCLRLHGHHKTRHALERLRNEWKQHHMLDEWDLRASKRGSLAVMSVRYPTEVLEQESGRYVDFVLAFIEQDIKGKSVFEVGSGIGRITKRLVTLCNQLTCVDLCERMHVRNANSLGAHAGKVSFITQFVQQLPLDRRFDVAVCSLVLIHNVTPEDFEKAVEVMCHCAKVIFVFEDVTITRPTSPNTCLRPKELLKAVFEKFGHKMVAEDSFNLFTDAIVAFKFERA